MAGGQGRFLGCFFPRHVYILGVSFYELVGIYIVCLVPLPSTVP